MAKAASDCGILCGEFWPILLDCLQQECWDFYTTITTAGGKKRGSPRDPFTRLFLSRLFLRPSCAVCPFSAPERVGDLVIGDYWGCERHNPELFNKFGVSVIFPLTGRGRALIPRLRDAMALAEVKTEHVSAHNESLLHPNQANPRRDAFFECLAQNGTEAAFQNFSPKRTWKQMLYPYVKPLLTLLRRKP